MDQLVYPPRAVRLGKRNGYLSSRILRQINSWMQIHFLLRSSLLAACLVCSFAMIAEGQVGKRASKGPVTVPNAFKASSAYAETSLRRTEIQAELESTLIDYTEEFPKIKELRFALARIREEEGRLSTIAPASLERATQALGKLMVRKVDAEVDLWRLQQSLADGHPDVKRAKKRVEIYEAAIAEILG
jgi:hypothetical protein